VDHKVKNLLNKTQTQISGHKQYHVGQILVSDINAEPRDVTLMHPLKTRTTRRNVIGITITVLSYKIR
jgi:hypothetical protein